MEYKIKKIGYEQYMIICENVKIAKQLQDKTGLFCDEILQFLDGKVRNDFQSYKIENKIIIW